MRFITFLFYLIPLVNFSVMANEHALSPQLSYHSKQESSAGYGIIYQYKFLENFEFEAKYTQSGDLQITTDEQIILGDYDSLSSGINFIKPHFKNLTIKFGFGINVITASSNSLLVEKNALAPYFTISANYKVTNNLSLTLGQSTYFNNNHLDTNHSLFLSINWLFGQQDITEFTDITQRKTTDQYNTTEPVITQKKPVSLKQHIDKQPIKPLTSWYVQLGSYQQKGNAQLQRLELQQTHSLSLTILFNNKLYRILSQPFSDKKSAEQYLLDLQNNFMLTGFINKI